MRLAPLSQRLQDKSAGDDVSIEAQGSRVTQLDRQEMTAIIKTRTGIANGPKSLNPFDHLSAVIVQSRTLNRAFARQHLRKITSKPS
jgi:hypothetical protein